MIELNHLYLLLDAIVKQARYDYIHKSRNSRAFSSARHFLRNGCWGMLDPTAYMPMLREERYKFQIEKMWYRRYTNFSESTLTYKRARQYHINNGTIKKAEQERVKRIKLLERMKARYEKTKTQRAT